MKRKVLVLGHDSQSFLSVVRSLGRAGIEVHVGCHQPDSGALRSPYVACGHDIPSFRMENDLWKTRMIELVTREKFDLVIPCHDPSIAPLQQHWADLEPHGRFYLMSDEAYAVLADKFKPNEFARSLELNVPPAIIPRLAADRQSTPATRQRQLDRSIGTSLAGIDGGICARRRRDLCV
jgi:hypothetical protein